MEIEKLIDSLKKCAVHQLCVDCMFASDEGNCIDSIMRNAAHTLEQLQAENDRLKRERDAAIEKGRILPEKCCCFSTCGGKKVTIVLDVEAVKEASHD